ncbi:MAG: acetyl-CoA carboxylase biotin carboxyl carrier protein [Pyrinomonadaceae bacterium MAG19_C2-C3]|nr:acetyl-CoA carboxylase biotin carboxyl carrier protein [Pyrinomonadaceae bacterium MAG19_C2-C3]
MSEQDKPQSPEAATNADSTNNQSTSERRDRFERHGGGRRRHSNNPSNNSRRQEGGRADANSIGTSVNMDELREVVELISRHGFTDFELEREGFRVRLRRGTANAETNFSSVALPPSQPLASSFAAPAVSTPAPSFSSAAPAPNSATATPIPDTDADLQIITSPIVGTFYRAASPTSDPFVKTGSSIQADTVVCIIEAMKLMNEIPAEISGTIEKIFVENAQPVEYGQPLFGVRK